MSGALDAALSISRQGWPVFPCGQNKRPAISKENGGNGFLDAVLEEDAVRALFARAPNARLAGSPTGEITGFDALDLDYRHGAHDWEDANLHRLPETRIHRTQSGGRHYLFRHAAGVRINASKIAPGIDVRGDGGYVILPPSSNYLVEHDAEIADWPDWLLQLVLARPIERVNGLDHAPAQIELSSRRLQGLLRSITDRIRTAPEGAKHFKLRNAALSVGGIQQAAGLSDEQATEMLLHALPGTVVDWDNARKTITWGLSQGRARPLELEDRPGWQPRTEAGREEARSSDVPPEPAAKNVLWSIIQPWDPAAISLRPWISKGYLMRGSVTVISGPGSAGKSSLMVAWASSLAIGCAFHRMKPNGNRPFRVATYNVEDDANEQKRRFSALLFRLGLTPNTFDGRLAILGPTGVGTLLHFARDGTLLVNTVMMDQLEAFLAEFCPDVLMLDPFVELHVAEENDNTAVRAVMARLRAMAIEHNMAVVILHHARKGAAEAGDMDSLRGASSIVGAARVVLTVNVMTAQEAKSFGLAPERRRNYFRLDGAKNNYAPIEEAEWFERVEIQLDNGEDGGSGDLVAVAWPWHPPKLWSSIPSSEVNRVMDIIAAGPLPGVRFSPARSGKGNDRWVGNPVAEALGINPEQASLMVTAWFKSGLLTQASYKDAKQRKEISGVYVDDSRRPT